MSGFRRAAVALYSLAPADQSRILAALPTEDRDILAEYLAELARLGFDKSFDWRHGADPDPIAPDAASRLRCANAADVYDVVADEPVMLLAQLLVMDSWPWETQLLGMLAEPRRAAVCQMIDAGVEPAPARGRFVVAAVSARLPLPTPGSPPPVTTQRRWYKWNR